MKAEQELLLNLHPSSTPPHPGLTLRPTGKRPSCVRKVDIFSQHPGPEMGTPRLLTSPSSPPTQDTADYVKPVAFSVEYSLEDPDHGPMLDDGWPTTLRVSVHPCTWGTQPWPSATPPPTRPPPQSSDPECADTKFFPSCTLLSPALQTRNRTPSFLPCDPGWTCCRGGPGLSWWRVPCIRSTG